jgi:hypothetical protein
MRRRTWLIKRTQHTLCDLVPAPPHDVRAFYADLHHIKAVHPLVVDVRETGCAATPDGQRRTYRVKDRIALGPLTLPTSYVAELTLMTTGEVLGRARQFPGVRLHTTVAFEATEGCTRVVENLTIVAPRPLAGLTNREAVKAHTEMLAGIRRHFGG